MATAEDYIKKIYPNASKPLYLANLGGLLKQEGLAISNLREFVEGLSDFTVVQGKEKEKIAIASTEDAEEIQQQLMAVTGRLNKENFQFLVKLPRNLLFAFASKAKTENSIYIHKRSPYRFQSNQEGDMVEIENSFLIDARIPTNLKQVDQNIAKTLKQNITSWSDKNQIDLNTDFTKQVTPSINQQDTLLEEMINAIPVHKRSKVVLSLDVIEHLIKKR